MCEVFLSPFERSSPKPGQKAEDQKLKVNTNVGIPLNVGTPEQLRERLTELRLELAGTQQLKDLHGSPLYVTGIERGDSSEKQKQYEAAVVGAGFRKDDFKIKMITLPQAWIKKSVSSAMKTLLDRMVYFFPSLQRDFVKPSFREFMSAAIKDAIIEAPNAFYLATHLDPLNATATLVGHFSLLLTYDVFQRLTLNWLLRPKVSKVETYIKQLTLSAPFILNYALMTKLTQLVEFQRVHGWDAMLSAFPEQAAIFVTTQGLTSFLQTLFYTTVVLKGTLAWAASKEGKEENSYALMVANQAQIPFLAVDSIILAQASAISSPLFAIGPMEVNMGHAALGGLTVAGYGILKWTKILDWSYQKVLNYRLKQQAQAFTELDRENHEF